MITSALSEAEYIAVQSFLEKTCGIVLGSGKEYLVTSRLSHLLKKYELGSYRELLNELQKHNHSQLKTDVIDSMTTNETFWFRDAAHFKILKETIYPAFKNKRLKLWSAACSSGQEPYSISMSVFDYKSEHADDRFDVDITATDISHTILNEAKRGIYSGLSASRGVDRSSISRYFNRLQDNIEVKAEIKRRLTFKEINLTQSYSSLGMFDVIFCRNVLIYFSSEMKFDIIQRLAQSLNPDGYLFIGSTEAPPGLKDFFKMTALNGGIVYQKLR